ncbi:MAG: RNA polymerase sigma factor [Cyclobacteriaceae bacterium]
MHNENELISGCIKGDRKAQRQLYELYSKKMLAVSLRYAKSQFEAEDILQEAFIKVFNNIASFRRESKLYTWIKRIVVNTALNHQRSKLYLYPMVDVSEMYDVKEEKDVILSKFQMDEMLGMIQELPTGCQIIFNLYAIEGYQHDEIAKELNINVGTSKSQYARAKVLLRSMIENAEKERYEKFK